MGEDVLSIDRSRYDAMAAALQAAKARIEPASPDATAIAAAILHREARLLDGRRYWDWLEMLTDDCAYWLPDHPEAGDPRNRSGINLDDRRRLIDRVVVIETGLLRAQNPPSRTCRMIGNIEAWPDGKTGIIARSNMTIHEHRRQMNHGYVGWLLHELVPGQDDWRIRTKIINLLDCDQPQGNVTFIL
jgi:benzoate/toluate 1,2-dioxygenase beta subunit